MAGALDTLGDYVAECRRLLQDEVDTPYRYPTADLVAALNLALLEVRRVRPDLLMPTFEIAFFGDPDDTTAPVNFEPMYRTALVYYVVGRIQLRDDEQTQDARAASLMTKFLGQLLSVQA
jgi:hypothetical protein